ncbi:hypothetical protein NW766_000883 [Fusarium irregulare]|uniref:Uncharacterized protein n=1 Tax=Fusarium irregulare TaxID=2494466 RepID=A0A9W8Q147_9HYPO|nr:hypothetical protein NW766_000883 [Fusarium irregulare]
MQTEHPLDKVTIKNFMEMVATGRLVSQKPEEMKPASRYGPIPIEFFEEILRLGVDYGDFPPIRGNRRYDDPNLWNRIFEILGSYDNRVNFAIAHSDINYAKGKLMTLDNPISLKDDDLEEDLRNRPTWVLQVIRATFAVFDYLNMEPTSSTPRSPNTSGKLQNIIAQIIEQFLYAEKLYEDHHPGSNITIALYFREWLTDYFETVSINARTWLVDVMKRVLIFYKNKEGKDADKAREMIYELREGIDILVIDTNWDTLLDDDVEMGGT